MTEGNAAEVKTELDHLDSKTLHAVTMGVLVIERLREMAANKQIAFDGWNRDPHRICVTAQDLKAEADGIATLVALAMEKAA